MVMRRTVLILAVVVLLLGMGLVASLPHVMASEDGLSVEFGPGTPDSVAEGTGPIEIHVTVDGHDEELDWIEFEVIVLVADDLTLFGNAVQTPPATYSPSYLSSINENPNLLRFDHADTHEAGDIITIQVTVTTSDGETETIETTVEVIDPVEVEETPGMLLIMAFIGVTAVAALINRSVPIAAVGAYTALAYFAYLTELLVLQAAVATVTLFVGFGAVFLLYRLITGGVE